MNKQLKSFGFGIQSKQTFALGLAAIIGLASVQPSAIAAPPQAKKPQAQAQQPSRPGLQRIRGFKQEFTPEQIRKLSQVKPIDHDDILLVMPNAKSEQDEISDALTQSHGEVIAEFGEGAMKILVVKTEHGKAAQTQQKLAADGHFSAVDFNKREAADWVQPIWKEPKLADSWHLYRMHCPEVFGGLFSDPRNKELIAVLDTGLQGPEVSKTGMGADCTGIYKYLALKLAVRLLMPFDNSVEDHASKVEQWGNLVSYMTYCLNDNNGHGTWVSSAAAGHDNGIASLGINPRTAVYPIRIADGAPGKVYTDELSEIVAMMIACQSNIRIVNISYGGVPDPKKKVLQAIMRYYHDKKNGLIFTSAGNSGDVLTYPQSSYLNVVSAMEKTDKGLMLASKSVNGVFDSNYGSCVTFTAPGSVINCCGPDGKPAVVYGTSFSSPIAAGIASLIWGQNRQLKNTDVERIMIGSCENSTGGRNSKFGYGMPDAKKAMQIMGVPTND
ncbi:hypothetical protein BH10CYA1_BH10CYA1_41210 [soil metagenome]